jgi:hypothetical protein
MDWKVNRLFGAQKIGRGADVPQVGTGDGTSPEGRGDRPRRCFRGGIFYCLDGRVAIIWPYLLHPLGSAASMGAGATQQRCASSPLGWLGGSEERRPRIPADLHVARSREFGGGGSGVTTDISEAGLEATIVAVDLTQLAEGEQQAASLRRPPPR